MGEISEYIQKYQSETSRYHFGDPGTKTGKRLMMWTVSPGLDFCEHDNDYSESINQKISCDI
jgi:hypothetical protein